MMNLSEMPKPVQALSLLVLSAAVTLAMYVGIFRKLDEQNRLVNQKLQARLVEVRNLQKYENNMPALNRQIATLKEQLEIQRRIVPDESAADEFMHLMQNTAQSSGIEIRRWTAKAGTTKEYYTEVPFDLELDGPYYSVLTFFSKVGALERIINIGNLQLGSIKGESKVGHNYQYAPQETVVGLCTATTFFSHDGAKPKK